MYTQINILVNLIDCCECNDLHQFKNRLISFAKGLESNTDQAWIAGHTSELLDIIGDTPEREREREREIRIVCATEFRLH